MNLKLVLEAEGDRRQVLLPISEGDVLEVAALLDALGVTSEAFQFACYVQADDTEEGVVWVRAHNDKMLNLMIFHYAGAGRQDVLVAFRPTDLPSPTSLPLGAPEAGGGGTQTCLSGSRDSHSGCIDNDVEPFTQEQVAAFSRKDLVYLPLDNGRQIAVSLEGLYTFAKLQLAEGTSIFKIKVCATLRDGAPAELVLTKNIWIKWITRGPHSGTPFTLGMTPPFPALSYDTVTRCFRHGHHARLFRVLL